MSKVIVGLDLIAGILVGAHFLIPRRLHEKVDKKIRELIALESGFEDPGHRKSLYISIAFVLAFFIALTVWGVHEDLGRGTFTLGQLILSYTFTLIGAAIGIGALVGIVLARRQSHRLQKWDPITTVMITSMGLSVLTFLLTPFVAITFRPATIGCAGASAVLGVIMEGIPLARRYLSFQEGVLARLGILVFIASKVIQLLS